MYGRSCFALGVAVAGEAGYTPLTAGWCRSVDSYDAIADEADRLNRKRGLDDKAAGCLIASTMKATGAPAAEAMIADGGFKTVVKTEEPIFIDQKRKGPA